MQLFFTADLHLGHTNIIDFCKRPFDNGRDMDEQLISNWNVLVKPKDRVYIIGDLSFHRGLFTAKLVEQLQGELHLIKGNHDKKRRIDEALPLFTSVQDYLEVKWKNRLLILSHYPFITWNQVHRGSYHLHGHSHGNLPPTNKKRLDVGVDTNDYFPYSFDEIEKIMENKEDTKR